jgi:multicomponent Na+:H+ antiporter subunit D
VLTLASFIKVAQSVFFGQLPTHLNHVKEVSLGMRIPMWILAVLCVVTGLFPTQIQNWLLTPAAKAAMHSALYIDAAMGSGYAAANGVNPVMVLTPNFIGSWSPIIWLLLLLSVTIAVCIVAVLGTPKNKIESDPVPVEECDPKYDSFFGGEQSVYSQVGGSDLFWGFKHNWRKYFSFMHNWHSGVVNDYTLYGTVAIAVVLVLCVIFL